MTMEVEDHLADFAVGWRDQQLSESSVARIEASISDVLAVASAGVATGTGAAAFRALDAMGGSGSATVIGDSKRRPPGVAALTNGILAHALDFDDSHMEMRAHPSACIVPALMAVAESVQATGLQCISAYAAGVEFGVRLGRVVNPEHYEAGWHSTSTLGCLASTVAAASILELDAERMISALALAATQASGLKELFGTMGKPFHAGRAAQVGVTSAFLAAADLDARCQWLTGGQGLLAVLGRAPMDTHMARIDKEFFGRESVRLTPEIDGIHLKALASCHLTHAPVFAARHAAEDLDLGAAGELARIEVRVTPMCDDVCNIDQPTTGLEAKFSLRACVAMGLAGLDLSVPSTFSAQSLALPPVRNLMRRTVIVLDADVSEMTAAKVSLTANDGSQASCVLDSTELGSNPAWVDKYIFPKASRLLGDAFGDRRAEDVLTAVRTLHIQQDSAWMRALAAEWTEREARSEVSFV